MRVITVGASGYLGAELLHQADEAGLTSLGTARSSGKLAHFDLDDEQTWSVITHQNPDAIIWAAMPSGEPSQTESFVRFIGHLSSSVKIAYISSDVVDCQRALRVESELGRYARSKHAEQTAVLASADSIVFITGPIFGETSARVTDKRTAALLESPNERREYWANVYKTFVPVTGLARTVLANLDLSGTYHVGPPTRQSYYDFYRMQAATYGIPPPGIVPVEVGSKALKYSGICADTSYADNPRRIWHS